MDKKSMMQLMVKAFLFSTIYIFFFLFSLLIQIPSLLGIDEIRSCLIGVMSLLFIESIFPLLREEQK